MRPNVKKSPFVYSYRLGSMCSHIAAILFKVEACHRTGMTTSAPTSELCSWNQTYVKKVCSSKRSLYPSAASHLLFNSVVTLIFNSKCYECLIFTCRLSLGRSSILTSLSLSESQLETRLKHNQLQPLLQSLHIMR